MRRGMGVCAAAGMLLFGAFAQALTYPSKEAAWQPFWSGGNLSSNGRVAQYLRILQEGVYTVTIRAYGSPMEKEWPLMALSLDGVSPNGVTLNAVSVATAQPKDYVFTVYLSKCVHLLGAAYLNDAWKWGENRNLYLDTFTITPPAGAPEPVLSDEKAWNADAPARDEAALARARVNIPQFRMGPGSVLITDASGQPVAGAEIQIEQTRHAFLFGANLCAFNSFHNPAQDNAYKDQFKAVFNYATLPFYWRFFEPVKGAPAYAETDAMVKWCQCNGISVKGHPLLYQFIAGVPPWSAAQPDEGLRKKHVTETVAHYKDRIGFWDVVNEPINTPGLSLDPAHQWAHDADPGAKLIINEYNILYEGLPKFHQLLEDTLKNKTPFDVVGIQSHAPDNWAFPLEAVQAILDWYAALGKEIHITEFFQCSNGSPVLGSPWRGIWDEAQQADYAEKFYRVCFGHPAVSAISWWDFGDAGAFKAGCGLLRSDLRPKPAYEKLKKLIREEWWTKAQGQTGADGRYAFTGYFGRYHVTVRHNGKSQEADFTLAKDTQDALSITLP